MEYKGYFSKLFVQIHLNVDTQSDGKMFFSVQKGHFSHGKFYDLLFSRKVRDPQLIIINIPKQLILGWHVLNPSDSIK